ncbi:MAG: MerR family transcriptional regulator [Candidatus Marinimicrobia bacterium]|jgi:MerR family transcriptional regulator/heat shock protein HspR|nr:MerR family transcriptional regulator [Candidatus Neomarinimicrobiota bacterium]MBT3617452.1 MerR family transcriptional regulator [Candidatus Neomarinimicrobiota bacterium]MBT3829392.1 MerR family transcriptional regulator [Candidatus Neomarinimicrobiota bacterium]MBT3997675.1 MerR family transcriptional regulator [Candidatus Neomarinimicrobiota bacterium]MBT4280973.1 MerR family transcriptional regulator [Candidatus Neomarinimicrobiota bacterium]
MNTSESQNSNIPNNDSRPLYTISIAAKLTNTAISTLRMYEDRGLILPHKTKTKRRLYSDVDINRILCIRKHLDEEGLNIAGIKSLLALVPCWIIKPCSKSSRNSCEAYTVSTKPCWKANPKGMDCVDVDCRECKVYQLANKCTDIKHLYKNILDEGLY